MADNELALISSDDSVWLVVPLRWWDLSTLLWWLLCPQDRKAKVRLTLGNGVVVSCNAVRVASKHAVVRIGNTK
jgi:hypothetical protein